MNDFLENLENFHRSIASQKAEDYARNFALNAFANSSVFSKNSEEYYYQYGLRLHADSVKIIRRIDSVLDEVH